ncbi:MAG: Ion transport 2 domain protein [Conexibacter sp.]|nr:Ion transport 2 domain protein [Conexibacter sp.]
MAQNALGPKRVVPGGRRLPRAHDRFQRRASRAIANGHVFRYLAAATFVLSFAAGVLVWLIDRRDFHTLGDALWWALVTLATVGYGDIVPHTAWGRIVGAFVIVVGVTFLSMLTATITSYFVSAAQEERAVEAEGMRGESTEGTDAMLREILERVKALEQAVHERAGPEAEG